MFEIHIDDAEVKATLSALQHRLVNPGMLMRNIANMLESQAQEAFRQEGPGWKPLALATIRQRAKRGQADSPILNLSGGRGLLGSLMSGSTATTAMVGAGSGKSADYAAIHQFGGMAGRGRNVAIPARPYLPMRDVGGATELTPKVHSELMKMLGEFVEVGL